MCGSPVILRHVFARHFFVCGYRFLFTCFFLYFSPIPLSFSGFPVCILSKRFKYIYAQTRWKQNGSDRTTNVRRRIKNTMQKCWQAERIDSGRVNERIAPAVEINHNTLMTNQTWWILAKRRAKWWEMSKRSAQVAAPGIYHFLGADNGFRRL